MEEKKVSKDAPKAKKQKAAKAEEVLGKALLASCSSGTGFYYDASSADELIAAFTAYWSAQHHNPARVAQLHQAVRL